MQKYIRGLIEGVLLEGVAYWRIYRANEARIECGYALSYTRKWNSSTEDATLENKFGSIILFLYFNTLTWVNAKLGLTLVKRNSVYVACSLL